MDVFTLAAKLTLDSKDYEKSLKKQETGFKAFGNKVKSFVGGVTKAATLLTTAASASLVPFVKNATNAYSQFQQLEGGIQTLFKNAWVFVKQDADKAFETAGMSANQYMETATSFAASLIQGLSGDTLAAAEYANRAIIDMSDNANKMGTDMESIQNAYRGFSKQNYTMLDNLKLGYGGTKTEMERLLKDAEKLTGKKFDISNFADIVDAIHAIQVEMGITGTTAKEASTTITGSWNATKAAWENLLVAVSDPKGNVKKATANLVASAKTTAGNVLPTIRRAVVGLGDFAKEIAPMLGEYVSEFVSDTLPEFFSAGTKLVSGLGKGLIQGVKKIKWPTWNDVRSFASRAWKKIQDGINGLGGLVFGTDENGAVKWPSWEDIVAIARDGWDYVIGEVAKFPALVFGEGSYLSTAFENACTFLQEFGAWIMQDSKTVADGITLILGAITVKKLAGLAAVNPLLAAVAAGALVVVTNWDIVKQKVQEIREGLEELKQKYIEPINNFFLQLQGGGNGALIEGQYTELITDWKKVKVIERNNGEKAGKDAVENYINKLQSELRQAGISAEQAEELTAQIDLSWTVEQMEAFLKSVSNARTVVQNFKKDVEAPAGDYDINYHINVDGDIPNGFTTDQGEHHTGHEGSFASGAWDIPYDNYRAVLHRNEMVLTASQARQYREGGDRVTMGGLADMMNSVLSMLSDVKNMAIVVDGRELGRATVKHGTSRLRNSIGSINKREMMGYGTR